MVQIIQGAKDPRDEALGVLSNALGKGLSHGVLSHFANKAIDDMISDPENENLSAAERLEKTRSLLSRYGQAGEDIFKKRAHIAQMEAEESKTKNLKIKSKAIGDVVSGKVSFADLPENIQNLFEHNERLAIDKHERAVNKEKAPVGGLGGMAVPPEQADIIEDIEEANPNATADQLENLYNKAGVYPAYTHEKLETKRQKEKREAELGQKDLESEFKAANEYHKESKDFAESVRKGAETGKKQLKVVDDIIKDVEANKVKPTNIANIFRFFGKTGEKLSHAFLTQQQAKIVAAIPEFLEGRKEMFGIRLSDADLKLLQDKLPDFGKSKVSNLEILGILRKYASQSMLKQEAAKEVLEEEGYKTKFGTLRPLNFEEKVDELFDKKLDIQENSTLMVTPDGKKIHVGNDKVEAALKRGLKKV